MSATQQTGRTYNQNHSSRPYARGKRRFSIYWTWSYPWEANRNLTELDNRFSTMTEVRRVAWPSFEGRAWDKMNFLQGIAGALELFHRSTLAFQQIVGEATGRPVAVYQRIDQAGYKPPIDERVLADTDTLMVFGLDHLVSEQEAEQGEIDAIREKLALVPCMVVRAIGNHITTFIRRRLRDMQRVSPHDSRGAGETGQATDHRDLTHQ